MSISPRGVPVSMGCLRRLHPRQPIVISNTVKTRPLGSACTVSTPTTQLKPRSFSSSRTVLTAQKTQGTMSAQKHERTLPAWFARGGTSNGLVLVRADLPPESEWSTFMPAAMGSPDVYGRQLNGIGSGISSTSKIIVLGTPTRDDVDVDYTFVQVGIKDGSLDKAGNCGNMSSLVGPMAWDKGMIPQERMAAAVEEDGKGVKWARVRLFNTNTSKVLESKFKVEGEPLRYCPRGDYAMDGVPGQGSKITLSFLDPAGAKTGKALPTGNPTDTVTLKDGRTIQASLVDVSNPGVFVRAEDMLVLAGNTPEAASATARTLTPASIEADESLKRALSEVRQAGTALMGLDPKIESVPKIVMLLPHEPEEGLDVKCRAMSMGQAHKAVPLTLALCLGAACQLKGSVAWEMLPAKAQGGEAGESGAVTTKTVTIGHASGKMDIGISLENGNIVSAELLRTARVLMKGEVLY